MLYVRRSTSQTIHLIGQAGPSITTTACGVRIPDGELRTVALVSGWRVCPTCVREQEGAIR